MVRLIASQEGWYVLDSSSDSLENQNLLEILNSENRTSFLTTTPHHDSSVKENEDLLSFAILVDPSSLINFENFVSRINDLSTYEDIYIVFLVNLEKINEILSSSGPPKIEFFNSILKQNQPNLVIEILDNLSLINILT